MDYFYSAAELRSSGALWPIFAPALIARWPDGIDTYDPIDPEQKYLEYCYDEGLWDCLPDGVAYRFLTTLRLPACFDPRDPTDPMLPVIMAEYRRGKGREVSEATSVEEADELPQVGEDV